MGAGHAHALHHHGRSRVHHLAPEVKVATALGMVVAFALTPPGAFAAFAAHALLVAVVIRAAQLPAGFVARRLAVVLPFIAFAFAVPFVAGGEQVTVAGMELSREGLLASSAILAKALLGATTSIVLVATTEAARILTGLERLRVPAVLTTIAAFMLRYAELLATELRRMRVAMVSRGHDPRWLWQAKPIATGAGALFVRSYERGERVHAAMLARGFDGTMPAPNVRRAVRAEWLQGAAVVAIAATTTIVSLITTSAV